MKVVVTGQVGLDKKQFLQDVVGYLKQAGVEMDVCHVGDMMYQEAPDVAKGRILDLPLSRLTSLRRSVFKDVLRAGMQRKGLLVNTHATFRWRHGLFYAFDFDQMKDLDADLYVALLDGVDHIYQRLARDGHEDHRLKDLMVWREEEIMASEMLSHIIRGHGRFFIWSRGDGDDAAKSLAWLIIDPKVRKTYLSFPMSHVLDLPDVVAGINAFRLRMKDSFICFDPGDIDEKGLAIAALKAVEAGKRTLDWSQNGHEPVRLEVDEVVSIVPDVDGQIYSRDFRMIDQADMIISLIPELPNGRPAISSGVERELQHAHEATKEVYVIWLSRNDPSPFVTETATKIFRTVDQAAEYFAANGLASVNPFGPGGSAGPKATA
jgi:adenylate kinase